MKEREEQMQVEAGALDRAVEAMAKTMYGPRAWEYADDDIQEPWRSDARECIQAADDHLREHYWAEFRERLLAIAKKCSEQGAAEELAGRSQIPALRHAEAAAIREATFAALATTQHKGAPQ